MINTSPSPLPLPSTPCSFLSPHLPLPPPPSSLLLYTVFLTCQRVFAAQPHVGELNLSAPSETRNIGTRPEGHVQWWNLTKYIYSRAVLRHFTRVFPFYVTFILAPHYISEENVVLVTQFTGNSLFHWFASSFPFVLRQNILEPATSKLLTSR